MQSHMFVNCQQRTINIKAINTQYLVCQTATPELTDGKKKKGRPTAVSACALTYKKLEQIRLVGIRADNLVLVKFGFSALSVPRFFGV